MRSSSCCPPKPDLCPSYCSVHGGRTPSILTFVEIHSHESIDSVPFIIAYTTPVHSNSFRGCSTAHTTHHADDDVEIHGTFPLSTRTLSSELHWPTHSTFSQASGPTIDFVHRVIQPIHLPQCDSIHSMNFHLCLFDDRNRCLCKNIV